jgi:Predicted transcriptional regulators
MTLGSLMLGFENKNNQIVTLQTKHIKRSKYNKMPISRIEELANQIKKNGLQNPIHVRYISDDEYIVVGGERRLTATRFNGERTIEAIIRHDIKTEEEEQIAVAINNVQREETKEILQIKIFEWEKIYQIVKAAGDKPKGMRKVEWIAQFTNVSKSTVHRYLKEYEIDGNNIVKKKKPPRTEKTLYQSLSSTQHRLSSYVDEIEFSNESNKQKIIELLGEIEKVIISFSNEHVNEAEE